MVFSVRCYVIYIKLADLSKPISPGYRKISPRAAMGSLPGKPPVAGLTV
jgi:hypothetical protein